MVYAPVPAPGLSDVSKLKAASPVREPGFCVSVRKLPTGRTIGAPVFQTVPDPAAPVQAPDGPPNCPVKLPPVVFATVIQLSVNAEPSEGAANNETPSINPAITTKLNILLAMFFSLAFVACCLARGNFLMFLIGPQEHRTAVTGSYRVHILLFALLGASLKHTECHIMQVF